MTARWFRFRRHTEYRQDYRVVCARRKDLKTSKRIRLPLTFSLTERRNDPFRSVSPFRLSGTKGASLCSVRLKDAVKAYCEREERAYVL